MRSSLVQIEENPRSISSRRKYNFSDLRIQQECGARFSSNLGQQQPYCAGGLVAGAAGAGAAGASGAGVAGALVAGVAGVSGAGTAGAGVAGASGAVALVDGVGGVSDVVLVSSFLHPVNNPAQTRPNMAVNDNNFFIRS